MRYWAKLTVTITAALTSALLLWAGFPQVNWPICVWIGLVPLLLAISHTGILSALIISLLTGMLFFLGIFDWIFEVPGYTFVHHSLLAVYLGSFFAIFGLVYNLISRRQGVSIALCAAPFLWVSLEFVRSNFSFLALPWGLLSHSQYRNPVIIQIAALVGAYGVSFLIVMVNAAVAALLHLIFSLKKSGYLGKFGPGWRKRCVSLAAASCILMAFALVYGGSNIKKPISGKSYKLALVQGNIEQSRKWDPKYAKLIMQVYADLSLEAATRKPDLIIWPESATPRAIFHDPRLLNEVRNIAKMSRSHLLLGSTHPQKFKRPGAKDAKYVNSAFLISPDSARSTLQRYDKIRLFPFGEYLPYEEVLPWTFIDIPKLTDYVSGKNHTILRHPKFEFGVTICWENLFPDLVRQFVKNGAQFMVNLTNEAWFGKTEAPYQFLSMSVFRAVENRVFMIRCANTGISCFIDPNGRVYKRVENRNGEDTFISGFTVASIVPQNSKTVYTRYGDWFVWLSIAVSFGFTCFAIFQKPAETI